MKSKNHIAIPSSFSYQDNSFFCLIETLPHAAHLKAVDTGKYLISNSPNANLFGITPQDMIGLTVNDLEDYVDYEPEYPDYIKNLDKQTVYNASPTRYQENFLTHEGYIRVQNTIKVPMLDSNNKVIAIFTCDDNLTNSIDTIYLFHLYKQRYAKRQAIAYFLRFFKIETYFNILPTEAELLTLLALQTERTYKRASTRLKLQLRTIDTNLSRLREKLQIISLQELIIKLNHEHKQKTLRQYP